MNFAERGQRKPTRGGQHFSTRGWVTPSLVGLLCLGLVFASYERGHGNLQKIKTRVNPPPVAEVLPLGPGGQDPIRLSRSATTIGKEAELISATFLPGRGMNIFQVTALIPGHGEVPLMFSPALASAATLMNGQDEDANGSASTSMGGAILAPWAQSLTGTPTGTPGMLQTDWDGHRLTFPRVNSQSQMSVEGLLLNRGADMVKSDVLPDGQSVLAVFHAGNFGGNWPSSVDVTVQAQLTSHNLDLTVTATNTGQQPAPFGIGWHPYFSIPSGDRSDAMLTIPSKNVMDIDRRTGMPTGRTVTVNATAKDFSRAGGTRLGVDSLSETYTDLESGVGSGPIAVISDPAYNYRLSVIPLTPSVTNMHVIAPGDKPWISVGPNTNLDDPFGPEWNSPERAGMAMLAPGATLRWKVRIEISLIGSADRGN
jgi:aldose 1-epimerase